MSEDLRLEFERRPEHAALSPDKEEDKPHSTGDQAREDEGGNIQMAEVKMTYSEAVSRAAGMDRQQDEKKTLRPRSEEVSEEEKLASLLAKQPMTQAPNLPKRQSSLPRGSGPALLDPDDDPEESFTLVPKPTEYEDLLSPKRSGSSGDRVETELRLYRQIDEMQQRLGSMQTRAEIAEEKSEVLEKRNAELKMRLEGVISEDDALKDAAALVDHAEKLEDENKVLKEQLRDAQSHIFSLQPYRKDLTPEEVGREYDDLIDKVSDWVTKFMTPYLDNPVEGIEEAMSLARKRPTDLTRLKRQIQSYPDLVHACMWPETDEDVLISIIMRFLHDNIFQKILYGSIGHYVEVLSFIETSLQTHVDPKRDLFAVRTWTAEAYHAILASPQFNAVREKRAKEMTMELVHLLKVFIKKDRLQWFFQNIDTNCVRPAMALYEKIQVSTHHFYLDINPYIIWGHGGELEASPEFLDHLRDLDCKNVLQSRKTFSLAKIDPAPSRKELFHHLVNVCTLTPALYMRQIGRKDAIKEPVLVRQQQMLVAWGPQEKRDKFREQGDKPIVGQLYFSKTGSERLESWAATFARWG